MFVIQRHRGHREISCCQLVRDLTALCFERAFRYRGKSIRRRSDDCLCDLCASVFQNFLSISDAISMDPNELTAAIIGAAVEVHRRLGPGLLESAYRICLAYELRKRGFDVVAEQPVPVIFDDIRLECGFRADLLVNGLIVVELKAKSAIHPIDKVQTLSHLRLMGLRLGLLINFHEQKLVDGVHRIINGY